MSKKSKSQMVTELLANGLRYAPLIARDAGCSVSLVYKVADHVGIPIRRDKPDGSVAPSTVKTTWLEVELHERLCEKARERADESLRSVGASTIAKQYLLRYLDKPEEFDLEKASCLRTKDRTSRSPLSMKVSHHDAERMDERLEEVVASGVRLGGKNPSWYSLLECIVISGLGYPESPVSLPSSSADEAGAAGSSPVVPA